MSDVARTAGVSVATVSKVINGRWGVAQSTVDRVQEIIKQLGYEADLGALDSAQELADAVPGLGCDAEPRTVHRGRPARASR